MDELKKKQVLKKRLYGRVVRITLVVFIAILVRPTWDIFQKSLESARNLSRAQEQARTLVLRQKELSASVESLKSDAGRDEEIRDKFGVAKVGETVVVIVDDKKGPQKVEAAPVKASGLSQVWSTILSWFGIR